MSMSESTVGREYGADVVVGEVMAFRVEFQSGFLEFDVTVVALDYRRGYRRFMIRPKSGYGTIVVERDELRFV